MNRLKDYLRFAMRFVGLGYIALWPVSTPAGGDLFGAPLLCEGGSVLRLVCSMPHPLHLGIGLHLAGALCAVAAVVHVLTRGICRVWRRRQAAPFAPADGGLAPVAAPVPQRLRAPRRAMPPPRKLTRPRTHFGLRGLPQ